MFNQAVTADFWSAMNHEWRFVTFVVTVASTEIQVFESGRLVGIGTRQAPVPRVFRESNYVGSQ